METTYGVGTADVTQPDGKPRWMEHFHDREMLRLVGPSQMDTPAIKNGLKASLAVSKVPFQAFTILISAAILWGLTMVTSDLPLTYRSALVIVVYSAFPQLLRPITDALQALVIDISQLESYRQLSLGLGRFLPADAPIVMISLAETFTALHLWSFLLIAVGLTVVIGTTWQRAGVIALLMVVVSFFVEFAKVLLERR